MANTPREWLETKWGALATVEYGKGLRDYDDIPSDGKPIRVFGTNGPIGWHSAPLCSTAGIVVGRKGAYRGIHFSHKPFFVIDTAYYLKPKVEFDVRWAYYQLKNYDINRLDSGSAIPSTSREAFYEIPVALPPYPVQQRIAGSLSLYDDLIENNARRIKILEEMAQMIYREWFVNFRFPGHENDTLRESEIGRVPNGWDLVGISNLYKIGSGGTPSRKVAQYFGGSIPWIKTKELYDGFVIDSEEKITESGMKNSSAKLFPAGTVLMAMYGATIGQLGILNKEASCNQACCAMTPHVQPFGTEYLFLTLKHQRSDIIRLRMGAAQQNISQEVIRRIPILKPETELLVRFNRFTVPVFEQIRILTQKNIVLCTTRDLILPKLMSGEISVEQIETEVSTHTV